MFDAKSYSNPLVDRYASSTMVGLWSPQKKFSTWRKLWVALAESEMELGLKITPDQISQLRSTVDDIDFDRAASFERELRHDVMAHVHTWREQVPDAGGIVHLGATSCYVTDNTDAILLRDGMEQVLKRLRGVIANLRTFCLAEAEKPCVGYTHFQPAQFTTVGKRASLWLQDLVLDHTELEQARDAIRFRGVKGTTGTQDSFMKLFDGDEDKVEELDRRVTEKMGFDRRFIVTGQTYTRKMDSRCITALSAVAQSLHKFSNDIRLLCHLREIEEPFEKKQIGSSAMAYKRNPMRCERIGSLSRFLISMTENTAYTEAAQWLERTLDDSANRRLTLPLAFMAADAILIIAANVTSGLVVRDAVIERHLKEHVPFIASEELMMRAAAKGGDRQELHEVIRTHAMAAADKMKNEGGANDFLERLMGDDAFALDREEAESLLVASRFIGRAPAQVRHFIAEEVDPILAKHQDDGDDVVELRV
ncbi:MAG: adenylosuccinate lyase [Planctomycetota bacterium]|jgi:adenylosuccinate lyase